MGHVIDGIGRERTGNTVDCDRTHIGLGTAPKLIAGKTDVVGQRDTAVLCLFCRIIEKQADVFRLCRCTLSADRVTARNQLIGDIDGRLGDDNRCGRGRLSGLCWLGFDGGCVLSRDFRRKLGERFGDFRRRRK